MTVRLGAQQVPGVYRRDVGQVRVATVNDGMWPGNFDHIRGVDPEICRQAQLATFRPDPPVLTMNTFLIDDGRRLMLVDSGFGAAGPEVGRLQANLAALGVAADDIDAVLITHLHADHSAGLIDREGSAVFRNAEIVLHEDELAFWREPANIEKLSDGQKPDFALASRVLSAYTDRLRTIRDGSSIGEVQAVATPGHTPGHTAWLIDSDGTRLLIWGDVIHLPGVQFAIPEAGVIYDVDTPAAAATRRRVLSLAAAERLVVAGIHLEFPAFGQVEAGRDGGFAYVPEPWVPVLRTDP